MLLRRMTTMLEEIVSGYENRGRDALLPLLWDVQTAFGHIDAAAVQAVSRCLRVPAAEIYGVISFYSLFHEAPTGQTIIYLCNDSSCGLAGADSVMGRLRERLGLEDGDTAADGQFTVLHSPCLGLCDHAPAALVCRRGAQAYSHAPITDVDALLAGEAPARSTQVGGTPVLLEGVEAGKAQSLLVYGDYRALRHALGTLGPAGVFAEIEASKLIGRGGAAFPTGMKWNTRYSPPPPRYIVCNADESEPGTFKDRALMEGRPHLVLEGMVLAGFAVGAHKGFVFVRGEYPESAQAIAAAMAEAEAAGLLGEHIFGSDFSFSIELRMGAGAYICGEETALFEAIEGKRGFPRVKPPYPTTYGLFGRPTIINNVETLCTIPLIIERGAEWFRSIGTERSTGPKLISVSGHVRRPGIYEIAPGMPLRFLLDDWFGGVVGTLQAVLMGGAAGTFLTPDEIDVPLTFEDLRAAGSTFGSGAITVFNDTVDLRDVLQRLGRFFQHESCGKCFRCQIVTQRQMEILNRLEAPLPGDVDRLRDVGLTMTEASLCGLGQTAASAVLSAMKRWPDLFEPVAAEGAR